MTIVTIKRCDMVVSFNSRLPEQTIYVITRTVNSLFRQTLSTVVSIHVEESLQIENIPHAPLPYGWMSDIVAGVQLGTSKIGACG